MARKMDPRPRRGRSGACAEKRRHLRERGHRRTAEALTTCEDQKNLGRVYLESSCCISRNLLTTKDLKTCSMSAAMASAPFSQLLLASPPGSQHASGGGAAANSFYPFPYWLTGERPAGHAPPTSQSASTAPLSSAVSEPLR